MIQQDYCLDGMSQPDWIQRPSEDYLKLLRCFWVFGITCAFSGLVYFFFRDIKIAAGVCGCAAVLLCLFHTPFGLFILFTLLAIENAIVLNPYFTISKVMGLVVLVGFILHMFHAPVRLTKELKLMIGLTVWASLGVVWSMAPAYTALACLTFVLNAGLAVIILNTVKDKKSLFLVVSGFMVGAVVASVIILSGHISQKSMQHSEITRATLHEDTSPVVLALALCLGFLAAFFVFFQPGKVKKIITVGLLMSLFMGLVKTQSRMPTLAALSIPVLALILGSKSENRLKYLFIAGFISVAAAVSVNWVINSNLLTDAARERIAGHGFEESGRLAFWEMGLKAFLSRPLHGYGLSNFHLTPSNPTGRGAHNNVVALTVDLGLVGLCIMATIFVMLYKQIIRLSDIGLKWLGLALLLYPLVTGITTVTYNKKEFWYVMAIIMAIVNIGRLQDEQMNEWLLYKNNSEQSGLHENGDESLLR
jgi:O-antigen ligase